MADKRMRMTGPQLLGVALGVAVIMFVGILLARPGGSGEVVVVADTVFVEQQSDTVANDTIPRRHRHKKTVKPTSQRIQPHSRNYLDERVDRVVNREHRHRPRSVQDTLVQ
ncbi:MAG: hypothetical protein ACI31C_05180 [Muribaculaceae bacterium]